MSQQAYSGNEGLPMPPPPPSSPMLSIPSRNITVPASSNAFESPAVVFTRFFSQAMEILGRLSTKMLLSIALFGLICMVHPSFIGTLIFLMVLLPLGMRYLGPGEIVEEPGDKCKMVTNQCRPKHDYNDLIQQVEHQRDLEYQDRLELLEEQRRLKRKIAEMRAIVSSYPKPTSTPASHLYATNSSADRPLSTTSQPHSENATDGLKGQHLPSARDIMNEWVEECF